ncbi:MAG: response regulator [Burkholderiaceae bacterium]|nr:response regulator [Burkholderiaceae bacterium]
MKLNVIIVDDSQINLTLFKTFVSRIDGLEPLCFDVSAEALAWCESGAPDIVIVDYMMPAPDGIEFVQRLTKMPHLRDVPVIMITANDQKQVRLAALDSGATDFLTKPVDKTEFISRVRNMATMRRNHLLLRDRAALLAVEVATATATIVERERETILRLSKAAEYRDPETGDHIVRMAHVAKLIGAKMGLSAADQQLLLEAAPMHDIGKVGIPDHILLKPGRLTPDEFVLMQRHSVIGHAILAGSASPVLEAAADIALSHHEKFDGSGYPRGLRGNEISLFSRIVPVSDVYDALTSERPYKRAWSPTDARAYIIENSGRHFDPICVEAFLAVWDEVLDVRRRFANDSPAEASIPHPLH